MSYSVLGRSWRRNLIVALITEIFPPRRNATGAGK